MTRRNFLGVILALLIGFGLAYWHPWEFFSTSVEATPARAVAIPTPPPAKAVAAPPVSAPAPAPVQAVATPAPTCQQQCCCCPVAKPKSKSAPKPKSVAVPQASIAQAPAPAGDAICPNGYTVALFLWGPEAKRVSVGGVTVEQYVDGLKKAGAGRIEEQTSLLYGAAFRQAANAGAIRPAHEKQSATFAVGSRNIGTVMIGGPGMPIDVVIGQFQLGESVTATISGGKLFSPWENGKQITLAQTPSNAPRHSCKKAIHAIAE